MSALPSPSAFTSSTLTEAQLKTAFTDLLSYLSGTLGSTGVPSSSLSTLGGAPTESPILTGVPQGPTAALGTNTTQLATTQFVQNSKEINNRNLLINGNFRVDQVFHNLTHSTGQRVADMWATSALTGSDIVVNARAFTTGGPTNVKGSSSYLELSRSTNTTLPSVYYDLKTGVEGINCEILEFGTANASTITLSFSANISHIGTYCVSIHNSNYIYSYVATFNVTIANTWTDYTITIPGCTLGTWFTTIGVIGLRVNFALGTKSTGSTDEVGTAGTWQLGKITRVTGCNNFIDATPTAKTYKITNVQLEVGNTATKYKYIPFIDSLRLCERYYERSFNYGVDTSTITNNYTVRVQAENSGTTQLSAVKFKTSKCGIPAIGLYNPFNGVAASMRNLTDATNMTTGVSTSEISTEYFVPTLPVPVPARVYAFEYLADAALITS